MKMKVEIRADGVHISGYVNVPGRVSRPVITPRGRVVETIEQRAFQRAIDRAQSIDVLLDHQRKVASTADGTLDVREDEIGLRAEAVVTDEEVIQAAKAKKIRGWSFGMTNVKDKVEERAGDLPLRRVKDLDLPEVSLVINKIPIYSATSVEVRADGETEIELRSEETEVNFSEIDEPKPKPDYTSYIQRIQAIKMQ